MEKAIIIGATSGIGRELAKQLANEGYILGLTGRRLDLLQSLQKEIQIKTYIKQMDVTNSLQARKQFLELIEEMNGITLVIINAGIGNRSNVVTWESEKTLIDTNIVGFTGIANAAFDYFFKLNTGHIVGISSISALLPAPFPMTTYSASKAYVSNYLKGLQLTAAYYHKNILVTDIKPGFIDTPMTQGQKAMFWVSSVEKAASQMKDIIIDKKMHGYVTKRWILIAWLLKLLPNRLLKRVLFIKTKQRIKEG